MIRERIRKTAEIFLYHLWKHERNAVPITERIVDCFVSDLQG
ncbi:MAG: hypothetical protein OJF50_005720 [Nitrospira sp.]|nr:hypothetical protein [Nitrospira sp.]